MGSLRAFLLAHEGGDRRLSSIAFAGGVASGFMVLMSSVAMLVVAQRAGQDGGIDPNIGALGYDLYATIGGNGMPITMAAMIAATGIVSVRTQALPRWFGWLSGALAIGLLTPVNWVLVALVLPWIAVTSVWIYLKARGTQAGGLIGGTASLVEGCLDQRGSPPV
jgi:hypothetical protein